MYNSLPSEILFMMKRMLEPCPDNRISSEDCLILSIKPQILDFHDEMETLSDFEEDHTCIQEMENNMKLLLGKFEIFLTKIFE